MQISDLLRMCAENLRRRKARSLLTIIGVVVGTCSIVIMMSFGIAIDKAQDQMINRMGDLTQINIYNNAGMRGDMMVEGGSAKGTGKKAPTLDDRQLLVIRQLPGVVAATPYYTASLGLRATAGSANRYVMQSAQLTGAYMDELPKMGFTLLQGSFVKSADISAGEIPVLVGEKTAYGFMDTRRSTKKMVYPEKDVQGNIPPPFFDIMKTRLILSGDPKDPNAPKREIKLRVVGCSRRISPKATTQARVLSWISKHCSAWSGIWPALALSQDPPATATTMWRWWPIASTAWPMWRRRSKRWATAPSRCKTCERK